MRKAQLIPTFSWICESCGAMNHCHHVITRLTEAEEQALREEYGIGQFEEGEFTQAPSIVVCPHCKESFETELED